MTDKRLAMLEKMVQSGSADSFARYALALEYQKQGRLDDALATFQQLRKADPEYLAQYLMAGQMLLDQERPEEARPWLEAGLALAARQGNAKAQSELETALAQC